MKLHLKKTGSAETLEFQWPPVEADRYDAYKKLQDTLFADNPNPVVLVSTDTGCKWLDEALHEQPFTLHTLEEAEYLQTCLDTFSQDEMNWFHAAVNQGGNANSLTIPDLVTITMNLDQYHYIPTDSPEELGKHVVQKFNFMDFKQEEWDYVNYEKVGQEYLRLHPGMLETEQGYVIRDERHNDHEYDGAHLPRGPGNKLMRLDVFLVDDSKSMRISLPATPMRMEEVKNRLGITRANEIAGFDTVVNGGCKRLEAVEPCGFDDFDHVLEFTTKLQQLSERDYNKGLSAMEVERPEEYYDALEILDRLNKYVLLPRDVNTPWDYADYGIRKELWGFETPEELRDFIDYQKLGEYRMQEDGVRETESGWLIRTDQPFERDPEPTLHDDPSMTM